MYPTVVWCRSWSIRTRCLIHTPLANRFKKEHLRRAPVAPSQPSSKIRTSLQLNFISFRETDILVSRSKLSPQLSFTTSNIVHARNPHRDLISHARIEVEPKWSYKSIMDTRRTNAPEVRESIEAKTASVDVEMKDTPGDDIDAEGDADVDMDAEGEEDAEGELDDEGRPDMYRLIHNLSTYLCSIEDEYAYSPTSYQSKN